MDAGHLLVARGAKALSRLLFALEWRWVPLDHWLESELQTLDDPTRAAPLLVDALRRGDSVPLIDALKQLEDRLAEEGVPHSDKWNALFLELIHPTRAEKRAIHGLIDRLEELDMLVSTDWLAAHLNDPDVRVADVRWYLFEKDKTGREEYFRGHIPGAVFLDVDSDLASHYAGGPGRHPLPRPDLFAESMLRTGIGANTHVVAYDDCGGATSARLWWLLRYFGHDQVSLLDGGITQWIAEGRYLETQVPAVPRGSFTPRPHPEMVVNKKEVNTLRDDPCMLVLDVRVPERYRGEIEPIDPRAGHVPGAKNAPLADNLRGANDLRFLAPGALHVRFDRLGTSDAEQIVAYCGSGINACQTVFALKLAGFDHALLYEGSWSDWSRDPELPAAVGPNPK